MADISKKSLDAIVKALMTVATSSEKVVTVTEKQTEAFSAMAEATKEATKATKEADSEFKKLANQIEDTEDVLTKAEKKMKEVEAEALNLAKAAGFKASAKFELKGFEKIQKDITGYKDQLKDAQGALKNLQEAGDSPDAIKDAQKSVHELNQKIQDVEGELKTVGNDFKTSLEIPRTPTRAIGNIEEGLSGIGSAFGALKGSPMEFASHMENAQAAANKLRASSAIIGKMPGLLGAAGKAAAGMAGALGGITKLLAGWPGLIAMAVVKVVQAGVEIDTYLKTLNKRFAEIRGPQIMTGDLKKQFKDFNNAIFSLGDNIRDGLNSDQVYDFMASIGTAGKRLTTLNEGFSDYRDAVHVAAKASKVFGMDITSVGAMMGRFSSDFGMNLKDMDKAFVQMSFDAERSGLSTDRFLGAVENASIGLSFYGSFIGTASKMMSEFTKTNVMGAKDAADATQDITQAFGKMTTQEGMAMIQLSGTTNEARKAFQDLRKEASKKAQEAGQQIIELTAKMDLATKPEKDEIAKKIDELRTEQTKNMEINDRLQAAAGGDILAMGQNIGNLTDKSPKYFLELIKKVAKTNDLTKLKGEDLEVAMRGVEGATNGKINAKLVQRLVAETVANGEKLKLVTGSFKITDKEGKENTHTMVGFLKKINKTIVKGDKHARISAESNVAATVEEAAIANKENGANADRLISSLKDLNTKKEAEASAISSDDAAKKAGDTAKAVDNTAMVLERLLGIDKESAKTLALSASLDEGFNTGLQNLIKASIDGRIAPETMQKEMTRLLSSSGIQTKFMEQGLTADKTIAKEQQASYDETFKGIRNMTLSIEDMKKIGKDEVEWRIKSIGFLGDMSTGITAMAAEYADKMQTKKMEEASKNLLKAGYTLSGGAGKNENVEYKDPSGLFVSKKTSEYTKELMTQNDNQANTLKILQRQMDELDKDTNKGSDEDKKQQKKVLGEQMRKAQEQIKQNNDILKNLQTAGAADQDMIDLYMAQLKGTKEGQEAILEMGRKKFEGKDNVTLDELKAIPRIGKDVADAFVKAGKVKKTTHTETATGLGSAQGALGARLSVSTDTVDLTKSPDEASTSASGATPTPPEVSTPASGAIPKPPTPPTPPELPPPGKTEAKGIPPAKKGLTSPEQVTQKGAVILDPGETILPKLMSGFQSGPSNFSIPKPGIMDQPKAAPAASPVTISINVSADTKDLAQQIAMVAKNEIRGYFYNNSVNNQG
jgi:hypothetical protein